MQKYPDRVAGVCHCPLALQLPQRAGAQSAEQNQKAITDIIYHTILYVV